MRRIVELDGIRAFAIVAVMCCHYFPLSTMLFQIPEFGWAGVELFFVLSGFLITSILLQMKGRPHPYKVFYIRRILRIFPPYYGVMVLVLLIAILQHDSFSWLKFSGKFLFLQSFTGEITVCRNIAHALMHPRSIPNPFTSAPLALASTRFPVNGFSNSFGPTWSLSIEEWFYILWAPMVLHLRRRSLGIACVLLCVATMGIRWFGFMGIRSYFDFFSRIDILLFGALLALWMEKRRKLAAAAQQRGDTILIAASSLAALLLGALLYSMRPVIGREIRESLAFSVFGLPLLAFAFAGLLSYIIRHAESGNPLCRLLRLKPLVAIGTISYTLYLVHVPVYFLVSQAAIRFGVATDQYMPALAIALTSIALSLFLAKLSFLYYESPILSYKDKLTDRIMGGTARSQPNQPSDPSEPTEVDMVTATAGFSDSKADALRQRSV